MQLNLFQWDLSEISKGFSCLAALRLDQAKAHFSRVLTADRTHASAESGLHLTCFWQELLHQVDTLPPQEGALLLWQNIAQAPFDHNDACRDFRQALILDLLQRMEKARLDFIEPDLCRGYLHLQLGDQVTAETCLRHQIKTSPHHGILYGFLADTLRLQGRHELANALYATALLTAPEQMRSYHLHNRELAVLVGEHGVELAPIYGFFQGLVPLVEPESPPKNPGLRAHSLLRQAEQARHRQDHTAGALAREGLKQHAPEVFAEYERWLTNRI